MARHHALPEPEDLLKKESATEKPPIGIKNLAILAIHNRVMAKLDQEADNSDDAKAHTQDAHAVTVISAFLY